MTIFDRVRYLITLKSNIWEIYSDKYTKIKVKSDDGLLLEKIVDMQNVVTLV